MTAKVGIGSVIKPLHETMVNQYNDAYVRQKDSVC